MHSEEEHDARAERVARNEALFREVNEEIAELTERQELSLVSMMCECGRLQCAQMVSIERADYEAVRAHGARFVVVPGHALPAYERVVARTDAYEIVEKFGGTADIAVELDPRSE